MDVVLYWLAVKCYYGILHIASLFHPKARLFILGRKGLLSRIRYALIDERRPRIWMHCASLGEFEQGRPVLEKLRKEHPDFAFVLTFFSPSGYEVRKDYEGVDYIFYLPMDGPVNARCFIKYVQPQLCIFVKYEFWYFLLSEIARRQIPSLLISAIFRKEQPFFKWYGGLHRHMLRAFSHIFVQDGHSEALLHKAGVDNVTIAGDTRFDRVLEASARSADLDIAASFSKGHSVMVAGSTWEADEQLLKQALSSLPHGWRLVLAPHEIDEAHLRSIEALFGNELVKWSDYRADTEARVLLVDRIGLLMQLYSYGQVAWIGGGFGKEGVHNTLEAAVYGIPLMHGPVYQQYLEARELADLGASTVISDARQLAAQLKEWEKDKAAYEQASAAAMQYVQTHAGATRKILDYLAVKKSLSIL